MIRDEFASEVGLTLTEVLVAVALLAVAMLPLLELQSRLVSSAIAIETRSKQLSARRYATDFISLTNPSQRQTGIERIGEFRLEWTAVPLTPETPQSSLNESRSARLIRLYRIEARLRLGESVIHEFEQIQIGWRAQTSEDADA